MNNNFSFFFSHQIYLECLLFNYIKTSKNSKNIYNKSHLYFLYNEIFQPCIGAKFNVQEPNCLNTYWKPASEIHNKFMRRWKKKNKQTNNLYS